MAGNDGGARSSFRSRDWEGRPDKRPGAVWLVMVLLVVFGLLGGAVSAYLLNDVVEHGDPDDIMVLAALGVIVGAAQIGSGYLIFAGINWGRGVAVVACGLNLVAGVIGIVNGNGGRGGVSLIVNAALIGAVLSKEVGAWCR